MTVVVVVRSRNGYIQSL